MSSRRVLGPHAVCCLSVDVASGQEGWDWLCNIPTSMVGRTVVLGERGGSCSAIPCALLNRSTEHTIAYENASHGVCEIAKQLDTHLRVLDSQDIFLSDKCLNLRDSEMPRGHYWETITNHYSTDLANMHEVMNPTQAQPRLPRRTLVCGPSKVVNCLAYGVPLLLSLLRSYLYRQ